MYLYERLKAFFIKVKNTFFYRLLAFFIIAVSLPAIGISLVSIKYSTENAIKQESQANSSILLERKNIFDQRIKEYENLVFQLSTYSQIWNMARSDEISSLYIDMLKIKEILEAVKSGVAKDDSIQSIYIYFSNHDYVLANTMYSRADFSDTDVFGIKLEDNKFIGIRNMTIQSEGKSRKVVTYIQSFRDYISGNTVFFAINLKYDPFFKFLETENGDISKALSYLIRISELSIRGAAFRESFNSRS